MAFGSGAPPEYGDDDFRRGVLLARQGLWQEAIAAYKASLRRHPRDAQIYLNLGFAYYEMGYDQEAQEAFDKASRLQARPCAP